MHTKNVKIHRLNIQTLLGRKISLGKADINKKQTVKILLQRI